MLRQKLVLAVPFAFALLSSISGAQSGSGPATFPGTDEGFVLLTGLDGAALDGVDVKSAVAGQVLGLALSTDNNSLAGAVALLGFAAVPQGTVPLPSVPGLVLDLSQPFGTLVVGMLDTQTPIQLQIPLPLGLAGSSLLLQGVAIPAPGPVSVANGLFAGTDGRRLDVSLDAGPVVIHEDLRFTALDGAPGDNFGFDVWIAGNLVAVGAPFDDNINPDSGSAYTFDATTGAQIRKFTGPVGASLGDNFGNSVVLRGDRLLVGAPRDDAGIAQQLSGKIYQFQALTGQSFPTLLPVATGSGGTIAHALGETTDLSEAFLVAGSRGDSAFALGGGSVHVFSATNGAFLRKLFPNDPGFAVNFGTSVAVSATLVAVGAPFDSITGVESGSGYLFDGATGQQLHKFAPTDSGPNDLVGLYVEVEGTTVLLGAPFQGMGAVYVYDGITGNLVTRLESPDPVADGRFGDGLAMTSDYVLIGESLGQNSVGVSAGVIHVYDRHSLTPLYRLETSDGVVGDALGESIEIHGKRVLAGARGADLLGDLSGAAYLFTLP
ncbi:MAG: hypothetical protein GC161_07945 [Planctomycetaceae bacterium]|nr:hypothetical protein [Planctomycetaceae bacterium]